MLSEPKRLLPVWKLQQLEPRGWGNFWGDYTTNTRTVNDETVVRYLAPG